MQRLEALFAAADANRNERTVPMTFYSGATVLRFDWEKGEHQLTLSLEPGHVRLNKLNSGRAPFTLGHVSANDPEATLGVISNARVEGKKAKADVRFSKRPDVQPIFEDVLDGILPNVSLGARLHKLKETTKEGDRMRSFLAIDWEPFAVALVGIGADQGAHFSAADAQDSDCEIEFTRAPARSERDPMNETYETTAAEIRKLAAASRLPGAAELADEMVARNISIEEARLELFDRMAARSAENPTRTHHADVHQRNGQPVYMAMAEALACRYTGQAPSDAAREFMNASIQDMAREICRANGLSTSGFGSERHIKLAMQSTSDFPALTTEAGNRILLAAYQAAEAAIKRVARRSSAPDFRTKSALRLGGAPKLLKVAENGSVTEGDRAEAKESYRLYTFARIFAITREALINDDLGAFADFARAFGVAAANLEAQELVDLLYGATGVGPTMGDGTALFTIGHGNLPTGGAIATTTFSGARLALRTSKDLDGETVIEATPKYLVVPAALETTAETYLATLYPASASNVNPFSGKLELIVEPRLDAKSATAWWMFADPALAPVLEYSYLNDAGGPQVDSRAGFEVLGMEFRCLLDYGVGAIGWRGAVKGNA